MWTEVHTLSKNHFSFCPPLLKIIIVEVIHAFVLGVNQWMKEGGFWCPILKFCHTK